MDNKFMEEALKEAKIAYINGDVPVGAVIVENNKIIARAHNQKETNKIATEHAEILVINEACKKINSWRLNNCTLYVTLEPCLMCAGAIIQSRMKKLVYATSNEKFGYVESINQILNDKKNNHVVEILSGVKQEEAQYMIQQFFKEKRY